MGYQIRTILWLATFLGTAGAALLLRQTFLTLLDLGEGTYRWARRKLLPRGMAWLREIEQEEDLPDEAVRRAALERLAENPLAWGALGLALAALLHDPMLSPAVLSVAAVWGDAWYTLRMSTRSRRMDEDAGNLVVQFESRYPILRSVTRSLSDALDALPQGEVRKAVDATLRRLRLSQDAAQAAMPLLHLPNPIASRFGLLLGSVQRTTPEVMQDALAQLREDVEDRLALRNEMRQDLTTLRGTVRFLQAVLLAGLGVVCLVPSWRTYYTDGGGHWTLYLLLLGVAVLGSLYVNAEIRQMEQ